MSEQNDGKKLSARVMSKLISSVKKAVSTRGSVIFCHPFVSDEDLEALKQQLKSKGIIISSENGQSLLTIEGMDGNANLNKEVPVSESTLIPKNEGDWDGKEGNSKWVPQKTATPKKPKNQKKTWNKINKEVTKKIREHMRNHVKDGKPTESEINNYVFDGVTYNNNEPDFSPISFGTVTLQNMYTSDRRVNYALADDAYARETGRDPLEVAAWMKKNKMTWHESADCQTMMKVPSIVHGNIPHNGGVNAVKREGKDVYNTSGKNRRNRGGNNQAGR